MLSVYTLIFLNLLIYCTPALSSGDWSRLLSFPEEVIWRYGFTLPALEQGEWTRLFSAMFLHAYWFHILLNMVLLALIGEVVHRFYRYDFKILTIYFLSGIGGFLMHTLMYSPDVVRVSVGASGAIFGLFGALILPAFVMKRRAYGLRLVIVALAQIWFDAQIPLVDGAAHLGGLGTGCLLSIWLFSKSHSLVSPKPSRRSKVVPLRRK